MDKKPMNIQCEYQTLNWTQCDRPASRVIPGARWDGADGHFCGQHANVTERARARRAAHAAGNFSK